MHLIIDQSQEGMIYSKHYRSFQVKKNRPAAFSGRAMKRNGMGKGGIGYRLESDAKKLESNEEGKGKPAKEYRGRKQERHPQQQSLREMCRRL